MHKAFTAMAAVCALLAGAAVMQLKLAVQEQAEQVEGLAQQIHNDRESIRILEAEWAYLTSPEALQDQSIEFLALMPPAPKQIIGNLEEIPFRRSDKEVDSSTSVLLPTAQAKNDKRTPVQTPPERQEGETL